ncbi:hypothetical protein CERSUDRAFT_102665 [Gelatoporia subvermispora B]|uniref:Uncharacterized protein n=1 Tax=Ceriporiopsis subvermispora (strain B) TaxID=914234 RepID=M2RTN3_CERS8|nr:hypothetical protein CERSUDRAFT_102665 [Gelatoporia subvermispora B]
MASDGSKQASAEGASKAPPWSAEAGRVPPAYASDPKYKKYTQQVDKCLASFDSVHEWADFISFLKQLLKTFQSYMQFKEIPRKVIVAKRLSQCLNPALPTGVHQRALDVYSHIFAVLGSEGLQRDLPLWSSGLFPFFEYAAISVKPTLINLFDTYYLPLQGGLRPVMKAFILSLLPGLEEETGEYFDKVLALLDRLSGSISPAFFFQNIWLVLLTTPSARGTALSFLARRLPTLKAEEDITTIVGRDIGLMIRAFSAALEDDDLLVRRGALDLLLQSLRIDSVAVRQAQLEDRAILMRAASSVVLRRDLSLNRRLYSWLLGPDEASQAQMEYFRGHALDLLATTLKEEMFTPPTEYSVSRPFKIFISLLDKWEIGSPLTEVLVMTAFKAVKKALESGRDNTDDILMTASTLYEAVEPRVLWRQLFLAVFSDILSHQEQFEGIQMVNYLLGTFHAHDEEIEHVHLPLGFAAIMEALATCITDQSLQISMKSVRETLLLQREILGRIPPSSGVLLRPLLGNDTQQVSPLQGPYLFACSIYAIEPKLKPELRKSATIPADTAIEDLFIVAAHAAKLLSSSEMETITIREVLIQSLTLLCSVIDEVEQSQTYTLSISWDPAEWLSTMLSCLEHQAAAFVMVDNIVTAVMRLQRTSKLDPPLQIDPRGTAAVITNTLLRYLRPSWAAYHMRAVSLIWAVEKFSRGRMVESVMSQRLSTQDPDSFQSACEEFGVLWRLTDDHFLPGVQLKVPMLIVLDTLKCDDPQVRRMGETWMRCSLKSYLRVLDTLLYDLLDPAIQRSPTTVNIANKELLGFSYERSFDQRYVHHVLEVLLSVVRFGGQGFSKICRSTPISRSSYPELVERARTISDALVASTYMDVIMDLLLRFLQSEPSSALGGIMRPFNMNIHASSVELLQAIVARGEADKAVLHTIESAVIRKLFFCIHTGRLDLQNKLLHLLHTVISTLQSAPDAQQHARMPLNEAGNADDGNKQSSYTINPLLVQTLVDGVSVSSNRPILQHWFDFVFTTLPQFREKAQSIIVTLNDSICRQLRGALTDLKQAAASDSTTSDIVSFATDAEFLMLLNAVERLVLLSLSHVTEAQEAEDDGNFVEKHTAESGGLLGYVSNVFASDPASGVMDEQAQVKSMDYRCLHEAIRVLYTVWDMLSTPTPKRWSSANESLSLIYARTRSRSRRVFEHLFRAHSNEVLESVVDCWQSEGTLQEDPAIFELVDVLTPSAQDVVQMICDAIYNRSPGLTDRSKKVVVVSSLSDISLFSFLEHYMKRLEGPLAVQVWGRFMQLAKDLVTSMRDFRMQAFSALRCLTALADKVCQTTAMEDRRMRKELQDVYGKLLDICVTASRPAESGSWIRRTQKEALGVNGRDSPTLRAPGDPKIDEKMNSSSTSLPDLVKSATSTDLVEQINLYIASSTVPNLRRFLVEGDKVLAACSSIIYSVVTPAMKGKPRPLDVEDNVLAILQELTRISNGVKAWKGPITEVFYDNRCFNSTPQAGGKWRPMVKSLFDTDKAALPELLGKITTSPSANIFTNREYEMLLRSLNLRRLSYVILSGEKNHFLTQLPSIQEKLVDTLRNVSAPIVQSEVWLCVRVLVCRLSPHNLSSFWPVLLTELYRLFDQMLESLPSDGSEDLTLLLAACKLLDLLLVLQTEEFQIHQWIFITDTVDAVYRPDNFFPEAMLDRLAEIAGSLPAAENNLPTPQNASASGSEEGKAMRRTLLRSVRQIDSIRDLVPFFAQASIATYESVYNSFGLVDWDAVEQGLLEDVFEGR